MPIESAELTDLDFASDGLQSLPIDAPTFDPPIDWSSSDDEVGDARFALAFESGGEG